MYNYKTISVVIPCFNESQGLDKVLKNKPLFIDEVIVVDNNSRDNTVNVAKKYNSTIVQEKRIGYGQACLAGLLKVKGDIIIILDGDNSYPMSEIEKLLLYMENQSCDFVSGNRYPLANSNVQPIVNQFANQAISLFIRLLFRINLKDSQSGMMVFKRSLLDKISLDNTGMGFSQEIKIKAWLTGICCKETYINYGVRIGKVKFRKIVDSANNLYSLLCLWKKFLISKNTLKG